MSVKEAKAIYKTLCDSGELELMFPHATGQWDLDKNEFVEVYDKNLEMLFSDIDLDSEEEEGNFYE